MTRFVLVFLVLLVALFALELTRPVQQALVIPWTNLIARVSAELMTLADPDVRSIGKVIISESSGFGVSIEAGCNGVEAVIILVSALLAFPAPLALRIKGILFGSAAVLGLNLVRIISLFYLGLWNRQIFEWFHLYVWPILIVLDALVVFLVWTRIASRQSATTAAQR